MAIARTVDVPGAHLYYETRINDEPVDPQRFLRAGAMLAAADATLR